MNRLSKQQQAIIKALQGAGRLTLEEIAQRSKIILPYRNTSFYLSLYMGRLVKRGYVTRIAPGVFEITGTEQPDQIQHPPDPAQLELF